MSRDKLTYEEALDCAKTIREHDLWIFEEDPDTFHIIRGYVFDHYAHVNKWIPRARITLETKVQEMWTGVEIEYDVYCSLG